MNARDLYDDFLMEPLLDCFEQLIDGRQKPTELECGSELLHIHCDLILATKNFYVVAGYLAVQSTSQI